MAYKIIEAFWKALLGTTKVKLKEAPKLYYKSSDDLLRILTVIDQDDDILARDIYKAESKILKRYADDDQLIDFQLVPKEGTTYSRIVPEGFVKYAPRN